ncbi:MAG: ATP-binding protein [Prevotella sp.]|nr:ATP-binding protein [Prevotella sp.]MBO5156247.1 ATP-binding protein [Prevotella sp.]MBO5204620.1 ATP-binding protein [Prevotella sp.]
MNEIKQIPYGVSDFVSVRERGLYYVDKTMYLAEIEKQPDTLIFIRPRRFGKSLFINMMKAYYDKSMADRFDRLFGGLWIGSHPTPLKNHYEVLYLDFSRIQGNIDSLEKYFNSYCCDQVNDFIDTYRDDYPKEKVDELLRSEDAGQKLNLLNNMAKKHGQPLYLIIDEYDNFTNVVLSEHGEDIYHKMTHADGFYRDLFKKFKGMFERIFITGVSPVTLDDLTSGFNIGWNVSMAPELDKMLGFSTEDVREMFNYYKEVGMLSADSDVEAMIADMKPWYDNYCFAKECLESDVRVFNCDMVLYYLRNYVSYKRAPEIMLDPNTKTDYKKLNMLIQLDRLDGDRKGVMMEIIEKGEIKATLIPSFSAMDMTEPDTFPSLLFYYGMLTIKDTLGSRVVLGIPNNNVRKQYYNYILDVYSKQGSSINLSKLQDYFDMMSFDGKWQDALQYIADAYKNISSVRDSIEGERSIQGFFMAYLSLNEYYITAPEVEVSHGYCDFFLLPNMTHYQAEHSYIIELKYLPKKDYEAKAEAQWNDAVEQINGYAAAPRVEVLRQGTLLHKIIMQFAGWELMRMEEV